MRVVLAPDKLAGSATAVQAAAALASGWRTERPGDELLERPVADGGPGFLDALERPLAASRRSVQVADPLGRRVTAAWLQAPDGAAYVESAQACGLHLLDPAERDPEAASSAGVGELLAAVLATQPTRVVVGVGGTATNDGGAGLLEVVGSWPAGVGLLLASDVDNPLLGIAGASAVFGPQKGADAAAVQRLDARLSAWVDRLGARAVADLPGAGAGGGLGFALLRLGARRVSGAELVLDAIGLDDALEGAGLAVTAEGRFDAGSLRGKLPSAVAGRAQRLGVACAVVAGVVEVMERERRAAGIDEAVELARLAGGEQASRADAVRWLGEAGALLARRWSR